MSIFYQANFKLLIEYATFELIMEPKVNIALEAARKGGKELLRFKDEVDKMLPEEARHMVLTNNTS